MKPDTIWSPCQQVGDEHDWVFYESGLVPESNPQKRTIWLCLKCGVLVSKTDE